MSDNDDVRIETLKLRGYECQNKLENELRLFAELSTKISKIKKLRNSITIDLIQSYENKKNYIDELINELNEIIHLNSLKGDDSSMIIINRYQTIKTQSKLEYNTIKKRTDLYIKRHNLFLTSSSTNSSVSSSSEQKFKDLHEENTETLLSEHEKLTQSIAATEILLSQASEAKESISVSNLLFNSMQNKVKSGKGMFPQINTLIKSISRSKNKDTIVLAITIAICILFTLYYVSKH